MRSEVRRQRRNSKKTNQPTGLGGWGQWEEENKDLKATVTPKHFPREQPSLKVQFSKWVERKRKVLLSKANVEVSKQKDNYFSLR